MILLVYSLLNALYRVFLNKERSKLEMGEMVVEQTSVRYVSTGKRTEVRSTRLLTIIDSLSRSQTQTSVTLIKLVVSTNL